MEFETKEDVAWIHFDDGKANAVGHQFIDDMNSALDRAEQEAKAVVLTGKPGLFSAGFDLEEFKKGPEALNHLVNRGAKLFHRLYGLPQPLIAACNGHAIAAGAFTLLSSDTRIGVSGDFKIGLNETIIGAVLPVFGNTLAEDRLSKRHLTASLIQATMYDPEAAVDAGFLDEVVTPDQLNDRAQEVASQLAQLPTETYAGNKRGIRAAGLARIAASIVD